MFMRKVFGVGLNKTGTTTLGICMKTFGYKHLSHSEELTRLYSEGKLEELMNVARSYDSFEDWPWPLMYKELAVEFPDAKFVLTMRSSDLVWLKSLTIHSYKLPPKENYHELVYGYKYPLGHRQYHLDFYNKHNADVIEYFRDQPGRLLVVSWNEKSRWDELCSFLDEATPEVPFPHVGATRDWPVSKARVLVNSVLATKGLLTRNKLNS